MKKRKKQENDNWKPKSEMAKESFWIRIGDAIGVSRIEKDRKYEIPDPFKKNQEKA